MHQTNDQFTIADKPSVDNIPKVLVPLLNDIVKAYQAVFGDKLYAVYVHGSASRGDWKLGRSDLDTFAIVASPISEASRKKLKARTDAINRHQEVVSTVEVVAVDMSWLTARSYESNITNLKLVLTGVCFWGKPVDFMANLPDKSKAFGQYVDLRRRRVLAYYARKVVSPKSPKKSASITRRYAKQAVRTINLIAVMRGAALRTSIPLQMKDIQRWVPEASSLLPTLEGMLDGTVTDVDRAVGVLNDAVNLYASFYSIYSD